MDIVLKSDPRRNPFTLMEKEYLVDLVEEHKQILDPLIRYNDSMTVFKRKQSWKLIEERYNEKFKDSPRDIDQLKRMWSKIKIQIKKYMNVPRTDDNIWNLARAMFHQYARNGKDDSQRKDINLESILAQISAKKDALLSQTESETNGSQHENSTPHTNASSDDDLIILNVVDENRSGTLCTSSQSNVEVLTNEPVPNGFLPMTYQTGSQNKKSYVCTQQGEGVPTDRTPNQYVNTNCQNTNESNGANTGDHQRQQIPNTDHEPSFAYCPEPSTSKSSENVGEYSLWQNIHSLDDTLTRDASPSDIRGADVRTRTSRRRQHGLGAENHSFSKGRVMKSKRDFYKNRSFKRNGNHLLQNDLRISKRSTQRDEDEMYEESEVDNGRLKEEDFLSSSSYRKRVLELAEEEHAQKMRLLKLKCEVLELQKQELESKLQK